MRISVGMSQPRLGVFSPSLGLCWWKSAVGVSQANSDRVMVWMEQIGGELLIEPNNDYSGNDFPNMPLTGKTIASCLEACNNQPGCVQEQREIVSSNINLDPPQAHNFSQWRLAGMCSHPERTLKWQWPWMP